MTVQDMLYLLERFPKEAPVCINDRGIIRDSRDPVIAETMNGPCVLMNHGTFDVRGYVVNYSKRFGFEMWLNDSLIERLREMPDALYTEMRSKIRDMGYEMSNGVVTLGDNFPPAQETIGPRAPRDFDTAVYEAANKVIAIIGEYQRKAAE